MTQTMTPEQTIRIEVESVKVLLTAIEDDDYTPLQSSLEILRTQIPLLDRSTPEAIVFAEAADNVAYAIEFKASAQEIVGRCEELLELPG